MLRAAAVLAVLSLAAPASAGEFGGDPINATECLIRSNLAPLGGLQQNDLVNTEVVGPQSGNFWARRDLFELELDSETGLPPNSACFFASITGFSVVVKTPFQITPTPDVDDIDSVADLSALTGMLAADFPDFDHFTGNAILEVAPGLTPTDFGNFHGVSICVFAGASEPGSVEQCLADGPIPLPDLGSGMTFGIDIFDCGLPCSLGLTGVTQFELVTILYSNAFGEQAGNDVPEAVLGWQFALAVPEPTPLVLLASALAGLALQRRRLRS